MDWLFKIALFVGVGLALNQMVNLCYRLASKKTNAIHLRFLKSAINVFIDIVIIYSLVQQFDITKDISKALLQSGTLIVAIATFAAQQALANVISGISVSASKPYNVDEKIRVIQGGTVIAEGVVSDVTIRHTVIRQFNGECCIVPNSIMDSAVIINTNYTENVGNFIEVVVSYDTDIEKAISVMKEICATHELTIDTDKSSVTVSSFVADGVTLKTTIWTRDLNDNFKACSDIRASLVKEFKKNDIEIPYQTVTIHHMAG
ncbi:hypothetical protein C806_01649 [Lachnospiraceae bacterium 3-1]|nr:hypothetical protein C806_01649 [Lachnospiraceae bacterium 3-1]